MNILNIDNIEYKMHVIGDLCVVNENDIEMISVIFGRYNEEVENICLVQKQILSFSIFDCTGLILTEYRCSCALMLWGYDHSSYGCSCWSNTEYQLGFTLKVEHGF